MATEGHPPPGRAPEVLAALPELKRQGWLVEPAFSTVRRLATGELASVRGELRLSLYLGVMALVAGISWFVKDNVERLGPATIALAGAAIIAGLFAWVLRRAEPFSWGERASKHLAFDFLLLLACLLTAAELAFIENRFTPLGDNWRYHLLLVSIGYGALALRFDAKMIFSLALSTFAAWRGVAVGFEQAEKWIGFGSGSSLLRWNALFCGALFVALGWAMKRFEKKAHFEPTAVVLGWILVLGAMLSGRLDSLDERFGVGILWALAALTTGAWLAFWAQQSRRFGLFALGVGGAYFGLLGSVLPLLPVELVGLFGCYGVFMLTAGTVVGLVVAHRRWFREAGDAT